MVKHLKSNKLIAWCTVCCLCAAVIGVSFGLLTVLANDLPEQPATTVAISSSDDLITYSREYWRGGHNPNDTIQLALSSGTGFLLPSADEGYISIGNDDRPFNGKIEIADNAISSFMTDVSLFGTVTTDMRIVNASDVPREIQIARIEEADSPLFAASVVKGAVNNTTDWRVCLKPDDRDSVNKTAFSFAGAIGSIAAECKVGFDFTHDSVSYLSVPANAVSASDIGLICGSLGADAELTVKITSTNSFNITSSGGHAGGIAGIVAAGAKIILGDNYTSPANVTASASGKYAGGIAGYAADSEIDLNSYTATVSKTVSGAAGAGGAYGYYLSTVGNGTGASAGVRTFELAGINTDSGFVIARGTDAGAFIGMLEAQTDITVTETGAVVSDSTFTKQVSFTGGTNRGGIIGKYANNNLINTLDIHNAKVKVLASSGTTSYSGGVVGNLGSTGPVYAKIGDFRLSVAGSAAMQGGLLGTANSTGSFIDVQNLIDIDGSTTAGLVNYLNAGVLRVSGTTDLAGATHGTAQLVRQRGNALVYALGSGSDASWTLKRGSGLVDDIGDWGEILRLSTANGLAESDFFTVNMGAHSVTVTGHVQNMGTIKDFVKTALNIQINYQDCGSLLLSSASRSSTILASNLSITADIDLSGTGIESLTKDNGENGVYTGSFNGNTHKITLAIGEPYGKSGSTTLSAPTNIGNNNYGTIIDHYYSGLFAKMQNNSVSNLTLDGYISLCGCRNVDYKVGAVAASISGTTTPLTLSGIDSKTDIYLYTQGTKTTTMNIFAGGAIGYIEPETGGTVSISNCTFESDITLKSTIAHGNAVGGAIGKVDSVSSLTFDFDDITIGGTYNNRVTGSSEYAGHKYGGLIGYIAPNSGSFTRNVTLNNITVTNDVSITSGVKCTTRSGGAGAFIGGEWEDTNVTIGTLGDTDGVIIGETAAGTGPSITVTSADSNKPTVSALVQKATGHWTVNHTKVNKASVTASSSSVFGFLVGDGVCHSSSTAASSTLYLDLISDGYDIANTVFSGTFDVFDEVVGFSAVMSSNIEDNGQAIVSIRTPSGAALIMNGSACNTYQNQTTYGKTTKTSNSNTRYYYNLDLIREKATKSDAEKMLLLSLYKYAHRTIRNNGYFNNAYSNRISGSCDMSGLSYYPVDASGITIQNASIKFYNDEIEAGEGGSGDSDGAVRSTRTDSPRTQHYMMHESVFRNYTGDLTVSGLHLAGNVSNQHGGDDSGFLICGMLGNTNDTARISISGVVLDGAYIVRSGSYAPLLINRIGKNVKFELDGVAAIAGAGTNMYPTTTTAVASSLIGDVGSDTAININLTFSDIRLDARTATGGLSGLSTAYGTSRSIFDRATLLNSFRFLNGSMGEYNYTYSEDWTSSQHHATYGEEVTTSVEYAGRQDHYYDDITHYTHPTDPTGASAYDFSSGFLPYVYVDYDSATLYHEIKVNVKDVNLTSGCGQYNDPYIITDGAMIATAAKILSGSPDNGIEIQLPTDVGSEDMWCTSLSTHAVYTYNGTNFVLKSDGSDPKTLEVVRTYLAGAYYSITAAEIELPATYVGLGSLTDWSNTTDYECKYAFRGVIVGNRNIIVNHSANPLIKTANGCVVKEATVTTDASITISQNSVLPFRYDNAGCASYGAVIGQVMGGDNIIDHVGVGFTGTAITADSTNCKRLVPVGGYVGVIVNGGVVFKNMDNDVDATGLPAAKCAYIEDAGWLYVNPIIGRVIAGYAFNEANAYARHSTKLDNGNKNYDISDLNPNDTKLTVNATSSSNYTVSAPNAQSLYILSCIVNSGAGSAAYNASTEQDYAAIANTPWIAYRNYTCTRCADYDEVGHSAAADGDFATVSAQDVYSGSNKTPYIIRNYTQSSSAVFKARSICGNSVINEISLSAGTYNLANSFRGIGGIYTNNTACRIQFKKLTGNGAELNLNMRYLEYNHESGNQGTKSNNQIENYKPFAGAGFGFFNNMYLSGFSASSNTNSVKNLTVSGSVFYDIKKLADGSAIKYAYGWHNYNNLTGYYPDVADRIEAGTILNVGGIAGTTNNSSYLTGVTLSGLSVEGAKNTGGYIGYSVSKHLVAEGCSTSGISVNGGFSAGGIIGGLSGSQINGNSGAGANFTVKGTSETPSTISFTNINVKGEPSCAKTDFKDFLQMFHCAGGLAGYVSTGNSNTATVQYVSVQGGSITATNKEKRPSDMRYKIILGGMFGRLEAACVNFSDSSVTGVTIDGNTCGGLIGCSRNKLNGSITNISVTGGTGKSITATNMVGGILGFYYGGDALSLQVSAFTLENYSIISSHDAEKASAGGLVGTLTTGGNTVFNIYDSIIRNCTVSRRATYVTGDNQLLGVGGMFGALSASNGNVRGHNILIDGVSVVNNGGNKAPGMMIGTNNGLSVKFTGVSIQGGTSATVPVVGIDLNSSGVYGSSGYVVMADFDGDCKALSHNESESSFYNSTNDLAAASPFVTVNPYSSVGNNLLNLTGDGVSSTVAGLPIQEIIAGDIRYNYASGYRSAFSTSHLSTYNYEQNTSFTDDFAVLIVDDISRLNTTNMINAYINLMAGTQYDYTSDLSNVFGVSIYKMVYDEGEGKFVKSNEAANLKRLGGQFYMNIDNVDTAGNMFSLIDVKYYDPNNTSKTAYHLYIPVLVKKLLTFDFVIATGTGTNYERAWYDDRFGKPLMENLGTPASVYFKYTYLRSKEEWEAAANGGENLLRNYDKKLTLSKSSAIPDLPGTTTLVLVDASRGSKPYYASFSDVYSAGVLNLSGFKETLGDNTSTAFTPINLADMLNLTAAADAEGTLVSCAENVATVKAQLNGVETFFRVATDSDSELQHYTVSVGLNNNGSGVIELDEPYYISFFTESTVSNTVYHYTISAPASFNDPSNPSRIADADKLQNREGTAHLILGNIFVQTGVSLTTTPANTEMSVLTNNHTLGINMGTTVTLAASLKNEVQGYLGTNSGINVFHSFMLKLTRTDESGAKKVIEGSPSVSGTYTISSANGTVAATNPADNLINVTSGYAEVCSANVNQNINAYLVNGGGAVINATVSMDYQTDGAVSAQFPNREDPMNTTIGTTASCTSNIAYDRAGTSYSKIAAGASDSAGHSYYCRIDNKKAKLYYNVESDIFVGDYGPLGINPLDSGAATRVPFSTLAIYDISDIEQVAAGYDTVRVAISLYKKTDGYSARLNIPTYMSSVQMKNYTEETGYSESRTNPTEFVFILPRSAVERASATATSLEIPIDYTVFTGAEFESAGLEYSNYKISISAELLDSSDPSSPLIASQAENYLIYTNARILPDFID
ncbi:MAG: hypothetical protein J5659_00055 [Clostridia bacterium]|nr:hypothetical protein [Clostridia bacterium]